MCGLILAPDTFDEASVKRAMEAMGYRGADGYRGITHYKNWRLGHVRLAIQSTELVGAQPFSRWGMAMAFAGEIFGAIQSPYYSENKVVGLPPIDPSQIRPLPNGEENALWGHFNGSCRAAHLLDGFWSVVRIGDIGASVFTDHLGLKPLYYWETYGVVCSEITPMFELAPAPEFDKVYLANCIKFGYDHSGRTPWEGIRQVPPGTLLRLGASGQAPRYFPYWSWPTVTPSTPPTPDRVRETIEQTIVRWAQGSNRPVGLLLSGGLDSSIIYYTLKAHQIPVQLFSVENGETEFLPQNEDIRMLPSAGDVSLREAVRIMQAPLDLGSLLPQVQLARALEKEGIHVCLSGDGADELFGGYRRAMTYDSQGSDVFCELPYYHTPRLDRVMMRSTVELRTPFLSPHVVAMALAVPYEKRRGKGVLKEAFRGIVPDEILDRPKHPLKSREVLEGGETHRLNLLEAFYAEFGKPV